MAKYAAELVALAPDVILAAASVSVAALLQITRTIPIVFVQVIDPVSAGYIASFNRPGGNVTGVTFFTNQIEAKRLGLLHELVAGATVAAVLINPSQPVAPAQADEASGAAGLLGIKLHVVHAGSERDLETAFARCMQLGVGALLVAADPFLYSRGRQIVALAAQHMMPTLYGSRQNVVLGGLASYGSSLADGFRQAGVYTGRVLQASRRPTFPPCRRLSSSS